MQIRVGMAEDGELVAQILDDLRSFPIPSPFAKDRKDDGPRGVEFPTPEAKAPDVPPKMTPAPAKPAAPSPAVNGNPNLADVKAVYTLAKQKWDALTDYEAKLVRKEVIGGKDTPAEEMTFKFRSMHPSFVS